MKERFWYYIVELGIVANSGELRNLEPERQEKGRHLKYSDVNKNVIAENDHSAETSGF